MLRRRPTLIQRGSFSTEVSFLLANFSKSIVIYEFEDGVSEGQFQQVLDIGKISLLFVSYLLMNCSQRYQ